METSQLHELFERVENFEIDEGVPSLSFSRRLARENGWSVEYADQVVREYKRFAILSVAAGHPVTPSEDVDQAWHLHLTYTRSYWERFCPNILGKSLHHNPTAGGIAEYAKFFEWYANTRSSYRRLFGEVPPSKIWPHPSRRFARAGAGRWIDPAKYWLIPKLRGHLWHWRLNPLLLVLPLLFALVVGCGQPGARTLNPFNFVGTEFLGFYVLLLVGGAAAAIWCRRWLPRYEEKFGFAENQQLDDPFLVAALANGPRGVVFAAIAKLFSEGHLKILEESGKSFLGLRWNRSQKLVRGKPIPENSSDIERVLYTAADEEGSVETKLIIDAGLPFGEAYRDELRKENLVEADPPNDIGYRTVPGIILGSILVIGLIKLMVGLSREKPVGFLVFLLIVTGVVAIYFLFSNRYLTPNGSKLLKRLKKQNQDLSHTAVSRKQLSTSEVTLSTALFGALVWQNLTGGLSDLHRMMRDQHVFVSNGGLTGGGCCGGCSDGGCGGCGGCGD